ncbi:hydrogenase maturation nickel metallochaperone HypA [Metallosphaera javensis (ex Sakai et al. 2022)]|uniref:hydrogenase maturation nickel metallochaperone HypA/HybF n=1 Tax=Metallosphaera javensis (ex Sakai et al. 2022) TaxID=2775498 RepID=UPI0025869C9B|nr:MAG: hydrogenase expression/synthesis, HypA [Metallosphaera javensis (ex Sakai et al. 2022)]
MHEWSIADAVVRTVEDMMEGREGRVSKIVLGVPRISFLDVEILIEAFDELKKNTSLSDSRLEVNIREPSFTCQRCGFVFHLNDIKSQVDDLRSEFGEEYPLHLIPMLGPSFLTCPHCGSHDISGNDDIVVERVEIESTVKPS